MRMRMLGLAAVVAGGLGATAASAGPVAAGAFAIGPFAGLGAPLVQRVADGCGPGYHLNPWGHCRPNRWGPPRGDYGPPRGYGYGYDRGYDRPPPPPRGPRYYGGY